MSVKPYRGPPMTLGNTAQVRLIVWCRGSRHQVEPDPVQKAARYGAEMSALDWREHLVCSAYGSHHVDMVVTGTQRR